MRMINCCEVMEMYNAGEPIHYSLENQGELVFKIRGRRLKPTTVQLLKRQGDYIREGTFFKGTITKKEKGDEHATRTPKPNRYIPTEME